jgi:hypothetical protein
VIGTAGHVLQKVAVGLRRDDTEVYVQPAVSAGDQFRLAAFVHMGDLWECCEDIHDRDRVGRCNDEVYVTHGRAEATEASRVVGGDDNRGRAQGFHQRRGMWLDRRTQPARLDPFGRLRVPGFDGLEQSGFGLFTHARDGADPSLAACLLETADVRHSSRLPDQTGLSRSHAGQPHDLEQPFWVLGTEPLEKGDLTGGDVLEHLGFDGLPDSRQLLQLAA